MYAVAAGDAVNQQPLLASILFEFAILLLQQYET